MIWSGSIWVMGLLRFGGSQERGWVTRQGGCNKVSTSIFETRYRNAAKCHSFYLSNEPMSFECNISNWSTYLCELMSSLNQPNIYLHSYEWVWVYFFFFFANLRIHIQYLFQFVYHKTGYVAVMKFCNQTLHVWT